MAAGDASAFGRKGVAYRITFPILDADGDLVPGATGLDSEVSKDGGTFAECTNEATEIATSSGVYYLDLTSTEMNADTVAVIIKTTSSGAKTTVLVIYPLEDGDIVANMTQVGGQTASASGTVTFPASISSLTAAGVRSELSVELGRIDTTIGSRLASASYTAPPTSGTIADAVWDEAYSGHTTAGTFGKLMDILRKANYVTDGSVAAGGTPTTTVFRTDLTDATGTFDNQTLLFVSGALTGQSTPIEGYSVTNGTITVGDPLTAAPTAGDGFVILPDHVHPLGEIADAVLDDAIEGSETLRQAVRLMRAALVGKLSGAATTTVTIRDAGDSKARITATVDADGNRSAVTTDAT